MMNKQFVPQRHTSIANTNAFGCQHHCFNAIKVATKLEYSSVYFYIPQPVASKHTSQKRRRKTNCQFSIRVFFHIQLV